MSRYQKSCPRPAPLAPDRSPCAQEPIHIPGAIPPHGALLAARIDDGIVTHASANLATFLARPAEAVLGRPLEEAIGDVACHALRGAGLREGIGQGQVDIQVGPDGRNLHLRASYTGRHLCVDIVPARLEAEQRSPVTLMQGVLENFRQASCATELCERAVRGLKGITGYDRVTATDAATGRFFPRTSFAAWCETVHGRSTPWSVLELALAGELRSAVALEQALRTKAELARPRHYDALTGLPN
jgi:light-regulated signal transduction histidine kinase (bacteriophytochrome)